MNKISWKKTSLSSMRKSSGSSLSKCASPVTPVFESLKVESCQRFLLGRCRPDLRTTIWQVVASSLPNILISSPGAMTAT